jgi:signal transduction histidine kinase
VRTLDRRVAEQEAHLRQRKELERQVQEASDREKLRAGEAMHEDLCQRLAGIEAIAKVLQKKMKAAGLPEAEVAAELSNDIREMLSSTWEMADELQPVSLLQHGFVAAIQKLVEHTQNRKGITCRLQIDQFPDVLDPAMGTHFYRIVQEALNNVLRHAKASTASIKLSANTGGVSIEITDDGCGFEPEQASKQGLGLRIMRYRAELIGADLTLSSHPGKGTVVTCSCSTLGLRPAKSEA